MSVKPKPFCPPGYEPVNDWIFREAIRRGHPVDRHNMPDSVYIPIFDDLANFLGGYDSNEVNLAVCNVNGNLVPMPVEKWRQEHAKRLAEISTGYIKYYNGLMAGTTDAKAFVRSDLRLPPDVIDAQAVQVEGRPLVRPSDKPIITRSRLDGWLADRAKKLSDGEDPPSQTALEAEIAADLTDCHVPQSMFREALQKTRLHVPRRGRRPKRHG